MAGAAVLSPGDGGEIAAQVFAAAGGAGPPGGPAQGHPAGDQPAAGGPVQPTPPEEGRHRPHLLEAS